MKWIENFLDMEGFSFPFYLVLVLRLDMIAYQGNFVLNILYGHDFKPGL